MNIGRIFHILVFVMAVLVFSMSIAAFAQQNSELFEAVSAAEQDAKADVNQINWWLSGCCLYGISQAGRESHPPPGRLVGKSPEYVNVYTLTYKAKVENLRLSAAVPGFLTIVLSPICFVLTISLL